MSLDFRICAAMFYQARRMAWISAGVGWSGRDGLNLAVIRMRRSLPVMSAVDSRALLVYQGGAGAVAAYVGGSCPALTYQVMAMLWQASWKGTVRRRARAVRLRGCPVPKTCLAASIAVSMVHLLAHPFDDLRGGRGGVGGDQARSQPEAEWSRISTTWTSHEPKTEYHR